MDFTDWTTDELSDLVDGTISDVVLGRRGLERCNVSPAVQDEACKLLYIRQVDRGRQVDVGLLQEIIERWPPASPPRKLIGEFAMRDLLSEDCLEYARDQLGEQEWPFRQIEARLLVQTYHESYDPIEQADALDRLVQLPSPWAVQELLPELSKVEVEAVVSAAEQHSKWSRYNRHVVREHLKRMVD